MSKYTPTTSEIVNLALRFFPEGKTLPEDEASWLKPIEKALRFYQMADSARGRGANERDGAGFVSIAKLVSDREFGRSTELDSVLEKRISPRFPSEKELSEVHDNLKITGSDSENEILSKIKKTMSTVGIKAEREVATVLCFLGWCPTREEINRSRTLHWEGEGEHTLLEKRIVKPTEPPTLDEMSEDIANALSEYWHTRFIR